MSSALVVAECVGTDLQESSAQLITAARELCDFVSLGIVCQDIERMCGQARFAVVDDIVAVRADADVFDHDSHAAAVRTMFEQIGPEVVLMTYTIRAASFAAALAEALDLGFVSDVVGLRRDEDGEIVAIRSMFGGKVHAELGFVGGGPIMALLRPDVWTPSETGETLPVRELELGARAPSRVRHREYRHPEAGVDLTRAPVVFTVGRGVGERDKIQPFAEIAERMGVALGASRPVVDAGWLPAPHQVGQTGVTVKPRLYVAFGVSGALQHLVGMQSSSTIVAVNTDPEAAIFDVAHEGAVADIHEVAEHIQILLGEDDAGA